MAKEQVGTRLLPRVAEQVSRFGEDEGLSKSDRLRVLIRDGLKANGYDAPPSGTPGAFERVLHETYRSALVAAVVLVAVSLRTDARLFGVGLALLIVGVVLWALEEADVVASIRHRRRVRADGGEEGRR